MDLVMTAFWFVWVGGFTALLVELGRRMTLRRLPPNLWAGIRVSRTLQNADTWYAVHQKAGPGMVVTGLLGAVAFLVAWYLLSAEQALGVWSVVVLLGVVGVSIWSLRTTP